MCTLDICEIQSNIKCVVTESHRELNGNLPPSQLDNHTKLNAREEQKKSPSKNKKNIFLLCRVKVTHN